jgi:hypothetical protein
MLTRRSRLSVVALSLVVVAGCAGTAATPSPTPSPTSTPQPTLEIDHKLGSTDLVLRYDRGGGFIAPSATVTEAPIFSLYGDGTVVFRDVTAASPEPQDGIGRGTPYQTARLSEAQVQALLKQAVNDGALGVARAEYMNGRIADAPTTVFTIHAAGIDKTVSAYGLGMEVEPSADSAVLTALAKLGERLGQFNAAGFQTQPYIPTRYRAMLLDPQMVGVNRAAIDWPWPAIKVTEFTAPADANAVSFPRRVVSADDVAQLNLKDTEGGLMGIPVKAPDGKVYALALRPLLPDETS